MTLTPSGQDQMMEKFTSLKMAEKTGKTSLQKTYQIFKGNIIDESKHRPGTLYVAANRYQVDDRQPYVFKTHDYGKTWTKIIDGIADGHFARAIREDHKRKGLLFLATEHGVYFSINDGAKWESLQLNLPDTPIRDLVIKDNDVVSGLTVEAFGSWTISNLFVNTKQR